MPTDAQRLVEMLDRQLPKTDAVVANIKSEQLSLPTPCTEWDVERVLDHLIGGCITMGSAARGEKSEAITESGNVGDDHVASFRKAAADAQEAYRAADLEKPFEFPWGQTPPEMALHLALADLTVHGWDLATATDQTFEPDEDISEEIYSFVTQMMVPKGKMPRGNNFKDPIEVGDDAGATERLLGYLGRHPEEPLGQ